MTTTDHDNPRSLEPEQQKAARTLDRNVSVTAGPGAGKTTVLISRYLEILDRHPDISVDQIAAITFTNRAANEMRTRLRAEIDRLMRSCEGPERARWLRHKRTLDSAVITTIHGFCARLLRQFPVEAGLDPQFELFDEHQTAMLEETVAEDLLTDLINSGDEVIARIIVAVSRSGLVNALLEMYRTARNQGVNLDDLAGRTAQHHISIESLRADLDSLNRWMDEFISMRGLTQAARIKQVETARHWPALRTLLQSAASAPSLSDDVLVRIAEEIRLFRECRPIRSERTASIIASLDELIWAQDLGGRVPRSFVDLRAREYSLVMIRALKRLARQLSDEKRRLGALDFDDLQGKAVELLASRPEALRRTATTYRFYLVDEFQDTNSLQRELLDFLAFSFTTPARRPNLFIVGDRKQSIYGFRGADVDVFRQLTSKITEHRGIEVALERNFRAQEPLVSLFNELFERLFKLEPQEAGDDGDQLGYVEYEPGRANRERSGDEIAAEILIDISAETRASKTESLSERDAKQVARRIAALNREFEYKDIALLFRAMTEVHAYESELRRSGIPYLTVQGKGFYAREEVIDLIQLLRFLDNRTDEIALAAVLRSPLCGLSDNALYALRCAPVMSGRERGRLRRRRGVRPLWFALNHYRRISMLTDLEREAAEDARTFLREMQSNRNRQPLADLLRRAVAHSGYQTVIAANFDGAARLANVEKLFNLAERFEKTGANLTRDFVRFVAEFERAGGRESEGQIDETANAVRMMTIHQSKGLEFRAVVIPELHRMPDVPREWFQLDRHQGLTVKVPDGRGSLLKGQTFARLRQRAKLREQFESIRLLYVASTRARDRLILSGAMREKKSLKDESWLSQILRAFDIASADSIEAGPKPIGDAQVLFSVNSLDRQLAQLTALTRRELETESKSNEQTGGLNAALENGFPLIEGIEKTRGDIPRRFSVTQLVNYRRCPRQFYFAQVVHAPTGEELGWWNSAEAGEPPANLTATLRGAVIHRFCERYDEHKDVRETLRLSFEQVLRQREAQLGDRLEEIDRDRAIADLMPLAENYVMSSLRSRIEEAAAQAKRPESRARVVSEQPFRLRRPLGLLSGTIDKLIIRENDTALEVEIVDFKANRFRSSRSAPARGAHTQIPPNGPAAASLSARGKSARRQLAFEFPEQVTDDLLLRAEVARTAEDYRLQMQAYALAVRQLMPDIANLRATLHFLEPNVEFTIEGESLDEQICSVAVNEAASGMLAESSPEYFAPVPADHCRSCSFLEICAAGRQFIARSS